jgi:alpha-glucosidase
MRDNRLEMIDLRALFTDETSDYRIPEEPDAGDTVILRFRAAKGNVDRIFYIEPENNVTNAMELDYSDGLFDYYKHEITVGTKVKYYFFRIEKGEDSCFYNRLGVTTDVRNMYAFRITPGFHTPEWAKGAVMYQIYVDRFCNGDKTNDVQTCEYVYLGRPVTGVEDWNSRPENLDVGRFYGGDLQGVWDKLDYLQYIGIEVIYFNPLFVSPSNHKYDSQDYDHIDPHYGVIVKDGGHPVGKYATSNKNATKYLVRTTDPANLEASDAFFARFMEEVHKRGMKVIMDGVFNHCGSFNKWLDRELFYARQGSYAPGAYVSKNSPYHTFFRFMKDDWPNNSSYDNWWGNDTLPKLNYEDSPKLYEYIMKIGRKWVAPPYNIDGWRLDVAADLGQSPEYNHKFWREFRKVVKKTNPDALILAEHYGDPSSWLEGDQWDTVMNYDAFMEPLTWFLTGMEKHSDEYDGHQLGNGAQFFDSMRYNMCRMQTPSLLVAMNQLSNHDHSRFLTRTNHMVGRLATVGADKASEGVNVAVYREAAMIQMTWPGAPTLYYGDETGVCGWTDPDCRRTFPWGQEDYELIEYHKYLIDIHKRLPALRRGSLKELKYDYHLLAYGRMHGDNRCVVIINNATQTRTVEVPVWELGIRDEDEITLLLSTNAEGYNAGLRTCQSRNGILTMEMPAFSGVLLSSGEKNEEV